MHSTIVCGVDRSHHARAAARLARGLAERLGLGLELIHVVDPGPSRGSGGTAAVRAVTEEHLDLRGVGVVVETGVTSDVLAAASRRAALLVVGSRGEGAMRPALLGSVSSKLTHDPPSAVVVVPPGSSDPDPQLAGRTIVCGVRDGRDSASRPRGSETGLGPRPQPHAGARARTTDPPDLHLRWSTTRLEAPSDRARVRDGDCDAGRDRPVNRNRHPRRHRARGARRTARPAARPPGGGN